MIYHYSKKIFSKLLEYFGIGLVRFNELKVLKELKLYSEKAEFDFEFIKVLGQNERDTFLKWREYSKAQLSQDILVALKLKQQRQGFFVEIGGADGVYCSNTHMLEKELAWEGVIVEPARSWHKALRKNRQCAIDLSAIGGETIERIRFFEAESPNLSTLSTLHNFDGGGKSRKKFKEYYVRQLSLRELLVNHNAPKVIDYLSIDVEGNEYGILENFNFSEYDIKMITCEHNFNSNKSMIDDLLVANGFKQIYEEISSFDGWYINTRFIS